MSVLLTQEDYNDLMSSLQHLKNQEDAAPSPRIIAAPCGTMHNHEVLMLEDSALPARRWSLSLQGKARVRRPRPSGRPRALAEPARRRR